MNDLIERYIYDVSRRLPEAAREEVRKELRANIDDMLPENPNEEDVKKVLIQLKEPRLLATSYRTKPRFLISPEWMDDYLRVLKITLIVFGAIALVTSLIDGIVHPEATNALEIFAEVVAKVISEIVQSLMAGFAIVTLIFAAIEAYSFQAKKTEWDPEKLPKLPKPDVAKISKSGSLIGIVVSVIFGVLFIFFLFNHEKYIGWFDDEEGWVIAAVLLSDQVVRIYIPLFIASVSLNVFVYLMKFYYAQWNLPIAVMNTIYQVLSLTLLISFVLNPNLILPEFYETVATFFETSAVQIQDGFRQVAIGLSVIAGIGGGIDVITAWVKTLKRTVN